MSQEAGPHVGTAVASGRTPSRPGPERQPTDLGHGAAHGCGADQLFERSRASEAYLYHYTYTCARIDSQRAVAVRVSAPRAVAARSGRVRLTAPTFGLGWPRRPRPSLFSGWWWLNGY
jgi:hypothetical protein